MSDFLKVHFNILKKNFSNPEIELRALLNQTSIKKKEIIFSNFNITDINLKKFNSSFKRRINREPVSKIFNNKSFWKYNFFVDNNVLDPRPESELLIEKILEYYPDKKKSLRIVDLCTGSGCLAISLAKEYKNAKIIATDISCKALTIAKINAKKLKCSNRIKFIKCDLIKKREIYDIVLSNPPYLSASEYKKTSSEMQLFEPKLAFIAKKKGFEFYEKISRILPEILNANSKAFIEIGAKQSNKVLKIFKYNKIQYLEVAKDLQNIDRVLVLNKP